MNILELAKEAGCHASVITGAICFNPEVLERFAALVRAEALADHSGDANEIVAEPVKQEPVADYAYATIKEYEELAGFSVPEAFRAGWNMARTTNSMLGIKAAPVDASGAPHLKAIREALANARLEALEEAVKWIAKSGLVGNRNPQDYAAAIRGLK